MQKKNRAATLTGYALLVGLISVIALSATVRLGENVTTLFTKTGNTLEAAADGTLSSSNSSSGSEATGPTVDTNAYRVRDNTADGTGSFPPAGDWVLQAVSSTTNVNNGATFLAACQVFGYSVPASTEPNPGCTTSLPSPQITVTDECNMARNFAFEDSDWLDSFPGGNIAVLYTGSSIQEFICPAQTAGNPVTCTLGAFGSGYTLNEGDYIACAQLR